MKTNLFSVMLMLTFSFCRGQFLLEDASGESTLYMNNKNYGWMRLNTSSSSATIGFAIVNQKEHGFQLKIGRVGLNMFGGLDLNAGVSSGVGSLIQGKKVSPDIGINGNFGLITDDASKRSEMSLFLRPEFTNKGFDLANVSTPDMIFFDSFSGWTPKLSLIYNLVREIGIDAKTSQVFLGISHSIIPYNRFNEDDLKKVTLSNASKSSTASAQTLSTTSSGLLGDLKRVYSNPLRIDFGYLPYFTKNKVGVNTYYSVDTFTSIPTQNFGVGFFFLQRKPAKKCHRWFSLPAE